jgi:signal transduction histidine kinase
MDRQFSKILNTGSSDLRDEEIKRHLSLSNYIAFAIVIMGVFVIFAATLENLEEFPKISKVTYGSVFMTLAGFLALILSWTGWYNLSRLVVSVIPITVLQLYPLLSYQTIDEFYFWYPFGIVISSMIPQIIFSYKKEKTWYIGILIYFFLYLLIIDELLIHFATDKVNIVPIIEEHRFFYTLVPIVFFIFTVLVISYLKRVNIKYQDKLSSTNEELNATLEELRMTQKHLIQSEKMSSLGTLTAGVAHEINNPLNYISGGIELIEEIKKELKDKQFDDIGDKCSTATEMLISGLDRATGIVKSLMTFSQRGKPVLIKYNIHKLIDNTLLFMNRKLPDDIDLIKRYDLKEKVSVYPDRIHLVLTNILDNAIYVMNKNQPDFKQIKISTYKENEQAVIKIFNTGPYIPEKEINQIFDPFFTTKDPDEGNGLGLSICYTFVNDHDGKVYAENETNGVSFIIELPIQT